MRRCEATAARLCRSSFGKVRRDIATVQARRKGKGFPSARSICMRSNCALCATKSGVGASTASSKSVASRVAPSASCIKRSTSGHAWPRRGAPATSSGRMPWIEMNRGSKRVPGSRYHWRSRTTAPRCTMLTPMEQTAPWLGQAVSTSIPTIGVARPAGSWGTLGARGTQRTPGRRGPGFVRAASPRSSFSMSLVGRAPTIAYSTVPSAAMITSVGIAAA